MGSRGGTRLNATCGSASEVDSTPAPFTTTLVERLIKHISRDLELGWTRGFFFLKDMGAVAGVGGVVFLLATGEILNTTDEVERISKTHLF